jgi:ABC-type sugar transport system ATPase subunit
MASILLDGVSLERSGVPILRDLNLRIDDGELLVIVGPSGSGKTSVLRVIAGLDVPQAGDVLIDGTSVTAMDPATRNIAMVFQDDTLYPFMTVRRNISFPLRVRKVDAGEVDRRVTAEARLLAIDRFLDRFPDRLAAGHQQLVQAARALVRTPTVFLLDEPLARMDAETRNTVRAEIGLLQRGYEVTTVYATNDQEQAMALGDRLVVLDAGEIRQVGAPDDVYRRPDDMFVAGFIGSPPMSFLRGRISGSEVHLDTGSLPVPPGIRAGEVMVGVRSHDWETTETAGFLVTITSIEHHGPHAIATVSFGAEEALVRVSEPAPDPGEPLELWTRHFHMFDPDSGRALAHVG